jgi:SAM-dependent methyltransferase
MAGNRGEDTMTEAQQYWDQRYGEKARMWSGRVNPRLAEVVDTLAPGDALDLGCGEAADARWLAERGWRVVAVDISATALDRAVQDARAAGLADRIDFQRHDLAETFPEGDFDLVSAQFLHTPIALDRDAVLRRAAAAVRAGGVLLIVDHASAPPWAGALRTHEHVLPSVAQVVAGLRLDPHRWEVIRAEPVQREAVGPEGQVATIADNVFVFRRHAAS